MGPAPRAGCVVTARPSASESSDLIGLVAVHGIACGALALARSQPLAIRIARSPAPSFSSAVTLARPSSTAATGGIHTLNSCRARQNICSMYRVHLDEVELATADWVHF